MNMHNKLITSLKPFRALALSLILAPQLLSLPLVHAQGLRLPGLNNSAPTPQSSTGLSGAAANAVASSSSSTGNQQADYIVALANSEPITNTELVRRTESARVMLESQGYTDVSESELRQQMLDVLIAERLQLQEAKANGITVDDYTLEQAEANVAQQNGVSPAAMYQELASEGISREQFRTQLRNQLTLMRVRERLVDSQINVTEQDINQYLREHPEALGATNTPDLLNLGHILVIVPENSSPAQEAQLKARIDEAANKIKAGESFAQVASAYSDSAERVNGGEIGLRPVTQYPELFLQSTNNQPVGSIVGPIRSGAGYHLLKVVERESGQQGAIIQNHARHILITPESGMNEGEAAALLQQIRQRVVQGGEDFATLAREYSQDGSASQGGDLGWASPGMFVPEFQEVLDELQPGEISQPMVSRFGMHLIQLLERRSHQLTESDRRAMISGAVREEKSDKAYADWVNQLRNSAYIEIRDDYND